MTRLLLVEDHVLVRQSIRAFLQGAAFEVVGEASTGSEALQLSDRTSARFNHYGCASAGNEWH